MNKKISKIGDRAKTIFKILVENYIATGEPLGSKSISSKINYQLSPATIRNCLLYTSPSPRDQRGSRMPSSA